MNKSRNELLNWYLAFLRRNAQMRLETQRLTPMGLVKADQELLKKQIEVEADKQRLSLEKSTTAEGLVRDAKPRRSIEQNYKAAKILCILLLVMCAGAVIAAAIKNQAELLILLCPVLICGSACLYFISAGTKRQVHVPENTKHLDALLVEAGLSSPVFSEKISEGAAPNTGDSFESKIDRYTAAIELMLQKEHLIFDFCPFLLCELSANGNITELNESCSLLLGYSKGELIGLPISELLLAQSKAQLTASLERCRNLSCPEELQIRMKDKGGRILDFLWRSEWSATAGAYFCMAEEITSQKENERMKAEMTAMINHDLRAPISGLGFWIDNMLAGNYGELSNDTCSALKYANRNINSVLGLLDNLLAVEKLETSNMVAVKNKLRLQECFNRIEETYKDWCQEAEIDLEISSTPITVEGDPGQTIRILSNLLSNAIKWSPAGACVKIRATEDRDFAVIEIEDGGPGIPDELAESLFERWSSNLLPKRDAASSGLGLYIAKKLAELQGGAIGMRNRSGANVSSASGGQSTSTTTGSVFWFSIPIARN